MSRVLYINEIREGLVEPLDKDGNPAPVDLSNPETYRYELTNQATVDFSANITNPLSFKVLFKEPNVPFTVAFYCRNTKGEEIRISETFNPLPPPPPPIVAVGGKITLLD